MGLNFKIKKHELHFKFDARTSRGGISKKMTWFIEVYDKDLPEISGYGECSPLAGLSIDDRPDYEFILKKALKELINLPVPTTHQEVDSVLDNIDKSLPSVRFGVETALLDLMHGGDNMIFNNDFYNHGTPIPINGLIWMGDKDLMLSRLQEKINNGYTCIKMKIGALAINDELDILKEARQFKPPSELELRVDANGAYSADEAQKVLAALSRLHIHSIEQPIKAGQVEEMSLLCKTTPVPIALDEELIGIFDIDKKRELLEKIQPQFIILKPSLIGGFSKTTEWINLAEELNIGWWVTSALESNIGLSAICQFTAQHYTELPQGLGTGELYHNNIRSPLTVAGEKILYDSNKFWDQSFLKTGFVQA